MKKILVLVLALLAFIGGAFGGDMLHGGKSGAKIDTEENAAGGEPAAEAAHGDDAEAAPGAEHSSEAGAGAEGSHGAEATADSSADDWFKFPKQFFVPILRNGTTSAVMILALTIEMPADARPTVEAQEHRLRDALLNALMVQANTGGFDGNFTAEPSLERLRGALLDAARKTAGPSIQKVLIEDIAKQDQ